MRTALAGIDRDKRLLFTFLVGLSDEKKSWNGECSYGRLSQGRGSPQTTVVDFVDGQNLINTPADNL